MKKMSLKWIVVCCGLLFTTTASAQLGNLLKNVLGGNKGTETQQTETEEKGNVLGSIFQNLIGTAKVENSSLKGDWTYESPAVVFESSNLLKKAGGSLMTNTAEKTLQKYLAKIGFEEGKVDISFDGDSTYTMTIGSRNSTGTYTVQDNEITLKRKGLLSRPVTANLALKGNEMQITFKADKLLDFLTNITTMTGNSTLNMIGNIAFLITVPPCCSNKYVESFSTVSLTSCVSEPKSLDSLNVAVFSFSILEEVIIHIPYTFPFIYPFMGPNISIPGTLMLSSYKSK